MKAYVLHSFDESPRLSEAPRPTCGARDILVQVFASSVNPVDRMVANGFFRRMQEYRLPAVIGRDVSGVVTEVGAEVTRFAVGERVFGFVKRDYVGDGTFAEFVACSEDWFVSATPAAVSTQAAGVLGLSAVTALACLDAVSLTDADTVFVNGATGGTGTFAVQLARMRGARVIATARPGAKAELVSELGADEVIDWTAGPLDTVLREIAPDGVNAVLDLAPPPYGPGGPPAADRPKSFADFVNAVGTPACRVASLTNAVDPALLPGRTAVNVHSDPTPQALARVASAAADGSIRAVISAQFDFDDVAAAFEHLAAGDPGKIALRVSSDA